MNAGEFLAQQKNNVDDFDSQLLLAHVMGRPRTWLLAHLDAPLSSSVLDSAKEAFAQLHAGTPLPYILGHWEFFNLDFNITKDVLIPRPETELLVEHAIRRLNNRPKERSVADVGTGSGAIAVSIAVNVPNANIFATDISPQALKVAKGNAEKFKVEKQITFVEANLLPKENQGSKFNLLCANLPYIPTETLHQLPVFNREPTLALDGGDDGLDIYRHLFKIIPDSLAPKATLFIEIEATQGENGLQLARDSFSNADIKLYQDLTGRDRLIEIQI